MKRKRASDVPYPWSWTEGRVDPKKEHIELRYGHALKGGWSSWTPIARIGTHVEYVFPVQWLLRKGKSRKNSNIIKEAIKELDFYLVALEEPDPWEYAIYHCGTMANAYSSIHWSYFSKGTTKSPVPDQITKGKITKR